MSELTLSQLIKIILGLIVFVMVVGGTYLFFRDSFMNWFKFVLGVVRL